MEYAKNHVFNNKLMKVNPKAVITTIVIIAICIALGGVDLIAVQALQTEETTDQQTMWTFLGIGTILVALLFGKRE